MAEPLLEVAGLAVALGRGRGRREILHGVDLTVGAGESVGLIGETGSGKSTLARTVVGLHRAARGRIRVAGTEVTSLRGRRLRAFRRSGVVQYVFQDPLRSLDPDLTVGESVGFGIPDAGSRVADALRLVGLDPALASRLPGEVSGGQRQRAAIARAMIAGPRLLICDEPVSALDAATRVQVLDLLVALCSENGIGLLYISHDLGSVAGVTDRLAVLHHGDVVEAGTTEQVVAAPRHPYTRLLIGSAPTVDGGGMSRTERAELRALLSASSSTGGSVPLGKVVP
ncbi:ABC transporter ATP-binding protein [Pseudonocardia benzenivorans]|uniref:Nickel-transporting ATPase n=2 Tax=Pseudonocardia TaxID=1847 RepID=F4CMK0_PSEUX|nr:ATP-binding cassette domain-containing protein [Pseudonocardia dioxanivorans]AEA23984.1 Nickel-transporting ATPase [Pseudonocardia dioxanivorans CB1190]